MSRLREPRGSAKAIEELRLAWFGGDPDIIECSEEQFNSCKPRLLDNKTIGQIIITGTAGEVEKNSFKDLWK